MILRHSAQGRHPVPVLAQELSDTLLFDLRVASNYPAEHRRLRLKICYNIFSLVAKAQIRLQ